MKFLHKYGSRRNEIRRARRELTLRIALVVAVLLFFAGMIIITKFRPRLEEGDRVPAATNVGDPFKNPQLIRLRSDVDSLLSRFAEGAAADPAGFGDMELLEKAISVQREVIRSRGSDIAPKADLDKLEELLTLYDQEMGSFLISQSERLEMEAEAFMLQREYAQAIEALERARNLQAEVNQQYPRSDGRDPIRLHRLDNQVTSWQTKPIADAADRLKAEAFALIEAGQFEQARSRMEEALARQQELNESHRGSRSASMARLREFELAWKTVQAAEDSRMVANLVQEARSALATEQFDLSIARAADAEALQRGLMSRFPLIEAAKPEILADIIQIKDTAASLPAYQKIRETRDAVRSLLRNRQMDPFKNRVSEWLRAVQSFKGNYPNSEYLKTLNDTEVGFLHENREDIPSILETVYNNLIPVPGFDGQQLYRTEVPQSLFFQVTKGNPSIKKEPQLPVDSATWEEAVGFLDKLGWILARPARLPEIALYKAALGEVDAAAIQGQYWSSENTDRETQPVGSSRPNHLGYFDLLGNVSEWLGSSDGTTPDRAIAIGGSARDNSLRLASIPEESRAPTERNRFVGFRFVVDMTQ